MTFFRKLDAFSRGVILCFVIAALVLGARAYSAHDARRAVRATLAPADGAAFGRFRNAGDLACLELLAPPPRRVAVLTHGPVAWRVAGLHVAPFEACEALLARVARERANAP